MLRSCVFLCALLLAASALRAQRLPSFDVASIKPNTTGPRGVPNALLAGGRYIASGATVQSVIDFAWAPLLGRQIISGPPWIDAERFDIVAKADGNPSGDTLRLMVRSLLMDRFALRAHMETRDTQVYELIEARSDGHLGPQLKPSSIDCSSRRGDRPPADSEPPIFPPVDCAFSVTMRSGAALGLQIVLTGKGVSIDQLLAQLSAGAPVGRVVVDRTGLSGTYDVELSFSAGGVSVNGLQQQDVRGVSIFTALQEQLGLKLESTTAPVDFLVVDSVDRPSAN